MNSEWWKTASTPARLVQIDAALSIGLTCEEARIICQCPNKSAFSSFCAYHGRRFQRDEAATSAKLRENSIAYILRSRKMSELERDGAFDVFNNHGFEPDNEFERAFR